MADMMEGEEENLITAEGLQALKDELDYLQNQKMHDIAATLKEARAQGDLSENAEYDAAKDLQAQTAARIEEIKEQLKHVKVVEADDVKKGRVSIGSTVTIEDVEMEEEMELTIKGATEADSLNGIISNDSPVGKALIGAKKGDTVVVSAPDGDIKYKVISISNKK